MTTRRPSSRRSDVTSISSVTKYSHSALRLTPLPRSTAGEAPGAGRDGRLSCPGQGGVGGASVVIEAVGDVRVLLNLTKHQAGSDGVYRAGSNQDRVTGVSGLPVNEDVRRHRIRRRRAVGPRSQPTSSPRRWLLQGRPLRTTHISVLPRACPACFACSSFGCTWIESASDVKINFTKSGGSSTVSNQTSPILVGWFGYQGSSDVVPHTRSTNFRDSFRGTLSVYHFTGIEALDDDAWLFAAGVGISQLGDDRPAFARHQRDVVVAVDGRQDAVAALLRAPLSAAPSAPGWREVLRSSVIRRQRLPAVRTRVVTSSFTLGKLRMARKFAFFDAAPVEVLGQPSCRPACSFRRRKWTGSAPADTPS